MQRHLFVGPVVLVALTAMACSGEGGAEDSAASESETTTTTLAAEPLVDGSEATTTSAPVVLTDSFRGVTAEKILLGYPSIDFDRLNNDFGLELTFAPFHPVMEALVEDLNANGGIHGRDLELYARPFLPVGPTDAEAICVELTEDLEVFAVLGGFSGPGAAEVNGCFTEIHDTILVGGNPTPSQMERATVPWITNQMAAARRATALPGLLETEGWLSELGDIGIIASSTESNDVAAAAEKAFTAVGVDVAMSAVVTATGDGVATQNEVDIFIERGRDNGVDTFLFLGVDAYANEQLILSGDEFNLLWLDSGSVPQWQTDPPPGLENTKLILGSGSPRTEADDPEWGNCLEITAEVFGAEVIPGHRLGPGEKDYYTAMVNACLTLRLFVRVATAAGPDLTNDSFARAVENFGSYSNPGAPFNSLGPGKYDGGDTMELKIWDLDLTEWAKVSEPYDVGG